MLLGASGNEKVVDNPFLPVVFLQTNMNNIHAITIDTVPVICIVKSVFTDEKHILGYLCSWQ